MLPFMPGDSALEELEMESMSRVICAGACHHGVFLSGKRESRREEGEQRRRQRERRRGEDAQSQKEIGGCYPLPLKVRTGP